MTYSIVNIFCIVVGVYCIVKINGICRNISIIKLMAKESNMKADDVYNEIESEVVECASELYHISKDDVSIDTCEFKRAEDEIKCQSNISVDTENSSGSRVIIAKVNIDGHKKSKKWLSNVIIVE